MEIDTYVRWLSPVTLAVAIIMIGWGLGIVISQSVTAWLATSATIWIVLLLISAPWQLRGSRTAIAALPLATAVISRLLSIRRQLLGWFLGALVFVEFIGRAACVAWSADYSGAQQ